MSDNRVSSKWPPCFEDLNYEAWKKNIRMWCRLTDLTASKQALAVHLSLSGRARNAFSEISLTDLEKENGVDNLLKKLDKIFLPEKGHGQFKAFNNLYNLRRMTEAKMSDFVCEFEHTYFKFKSEEMSLPDPVLALMLLASCNLSENDHHLVMSAVTDVTYDKIQDAILRIFGHSVVIGRGSSAAAKPEVKVEPVLCSENKPIGKENVFYTRGRVNFYSRRGNRRGRGRAGVSYSGAGASYSTDLRGRKLNPLGPDGQVSTCAVCKSVLHWARDCPDASERSKPEVVKDSESEINFPMFVGCARDGVDDKLQSFVNETENCAVLDSGCSNTVCGEDWLRKYISNLSDYEQSLVKERTSNQTFTFVLLKKVTLPCWLGGVRGEVTTGVILCTIPLLLSRKSMKMFGMILDFKNDKISFGSNGSDCIGLRVTSSGHYAVPLTL